MATVADQRLHGTTHERPIDRFARETLTPLGARAPYHYERERVRRVPADALVAIGAARYSVPVQYVGRTVTVQETATHYEIFYGRRRVLRAMRKPPATPSSWSGAIIGACSDPDGLAPAAGPPQWDPAYQPVGEVMVRDLAALRGGG